MSSSGIDTISSLYSASITFSGLGSDIDYQSMIEKLVEVESYALNRMETWKAEWNEKIEALNTLNTLLSDFKASVAAMDTPAEFQSRTASSSNTTVLTASATSTAATGNHEVVVAQLAKSETIVHQGVSASDTVINDSGATKDFVFTYGSNPAVTISVANGATLSDLVDAINTSGANPGVTASILDMGSGAGASRYRLVLQGNDTGAAYDLTIDDSLTTLDGTSSTIDFRTSTYTESQTAQDARLRVDGYPADGWIERATNTVTDVINGVSLKLTSPAAFTAPGAASAWSGASTATPTSGGLYTGTVAKTYTLTVTQGGTVPAPSPDVILQWSDGTNSGTITLDADYNGGWVEVAEGTQIRFAAGTLVLGDSFTYDVTPTTSNTITQVTVANDLDAMQAKIEEMVGNYNEVIAYIKEQTYYNTDTGKAGVLFGNYAVNIVKNKLNAIGTGNAPGFNSDYDPFINLAQLGISTDADETSETFGQLIIDSAKLQSALLSSPQGVADLLAVYFQGVSDDANGNITYYSSIPGITRPGIYEIDATVVGGVLTGTINGHPASVEGDTLTGQSGYPECGLAVRVNLVDGHYTGTVRLKLGINGQFEAELADLLSASSGPINILIDNYNDIIDGIDQKIEREQRRLTSLQNRLVTQFAALEATLSELNSQAEYLSSQINKLSNSS
ncbi:MAG: flagellar filament capping protein FliD [Desulfobacca sp.]|nr:flagellar filament capping protein FliD [Desulfobacca sp.]